MQLPWRFRATSRCLRGCPQGLRNVGQGSFLFVAYLHAPDPEETTFRRSLSHFLTNAVEPRFEARGITRCLGCEDGRDPPQTFEGALNHVGRLSPREPLA